VDGQTWAAYGEDLEANLYLHYVFDLWADHWRRTQATGDVVIVRYADDFVVGFQHRHEAERFLADLRERFRRFNLERHPYRDQPLLLCCHPERAEKSRGVSLWEPANGKTTARFLDSVAAATSLGMTTLASRPGKTVTPPFTEGVPGTQYSIA
jgi:hypothetical protein